MLRSTYQGPAPLPPGWTEHKAPNGHTYYYNTATKQSTYKRPEPAQTALPPPIPSLGAGFGPLIPHLSNPAVANAFIAQTRAQEAASRPRQARDDDSRGGPQSSRPRPQPIDKPRSKIPIPNYEPWILVYTKYGRRFVYNPVKNASYWRIPEKIMPGILELDRMRIREKAGLPDLAAKPQEVDGETSTSSKAPLERSSETLSSTKTETAVEQNPYDDSSEYEEVEVTDDEGAEDAEEEIGEHRAKRQRTGEPTGEEALEIDEAEMALQLQMMGEEYGLEPGEYDDGNSEDWPEGAEGLEFSEEDARELFKDLLNDLSINPYSPWDKLIEDGHIFDDPRYTALSTTKERKAVWEEWSKAKIREIQEQRAKEEKKDPRLGYMLFLEAKATPKLFWPEFKRKYRKEPEMKNLSLADKDREKWYREYVNRLKTSQATLKSDLSAFLKTLPLSILNNASSVSNLPPQLRGDIRFISLDAKTREPLLEAYIQTLDPPPSGDGADDSIDVEAREKALEARHRREKALQERDRAVEEQKKRQEERIRAGRAMLRDEERELERAMQVGKQGLKSQLQAGREGQ